MQAPIEPGRSRITRLVKNSGPGYRPLSLISASSPLFETTGALAEGVPVLQNHMPSRRPRAAVGWSRRRWAYAPRAPWRAAFGDRIRTPIGTLHHAERVHARAGSGLAFTSQHDLNRNNLLPQLVDERASGEPRRDLDRNP